MFKSTPVTIEYSNHLREDLDSQLALSAFNAKHNCLLGESLEGQ